jgi:hypothetical protein
METEFFWSWERWMEFGCDLLEMELELAVNVVAEK